MASVRMSYGEVQSLGGSRGVKADASIEVEIATSDIPVALGHLRDLWASLRREVQAQFEQAERERCGLAPGVGNGGEELPCEERVKKLEAERDAIKSDLLELAADVWLQWGLVLPDGRRDAGCLGTLEIAEDILRRHGRIDERGRFAWERSTEEGEEAR